MSKPQEGMEALAGKYGKSEADDSSEKVYRLPGDNTWEYLVKDGEWMTRKIGTQSLIPILSLSADKSAKALGKLSRFTEGMEFAPGLDLSGGAPELDISGGGVDRMRDLPELDISGGGVDRMREAQVFALFDDNDPYEYSVIDGNWVTRKIGSDRFIPLTGLPIDKQLEAIEKLDRNFPDVRSGQDKAKTEEKISTKLLEMPEGDPIAERVSDMKRLAKRYASIK
jgi:hypothetical protein